MPLPLLASSRLPELRPSSSRKCPLELRYGCDAEFRHERFLVFVTM